MHFHLFVLLANKEIEERAQGMWAVLVVAATTASRLIRSGRHYDPLNGIAAGEIFEYLTAPIYFPPDPSAVATIFRRNARRFGQARHVASIVTSWLIDAGATREAAMASHATIMAAAILLPV
ncbi:hypothetical protein C7I85_29915 [Mesorhizobium soli]|uniref:Uncharacterized protein n=2 Tax=Pseudaminobacter soli (ex Li et al. 2025) TaxID=1295366 RepID=A0A2P7RKK8_9HYPH|nr:hypothetical protein C7I85_29915 [Mesorhizobium soli]